MDRETAALWIIRLRELAHDMQNVAPSHLYANEWDAFRADAERLAAKIELQQLPQP